MPAIEKGMLTIDGEDNQDDNARDQCAEHMAADPWVGNTAPGQTDEEEHAAGNKKGDSNVIQLLDLLSLGLATDVELGIARRVVKEESEDQGNGGEDDAHVEAPAPAGSSVCDEGTSDRGPKHGKGDGGEEDTTDDGAPEPVGDELAKKDAKGQLLGRSDAIEDAGSNQGLDGLRCGSDDAPDQTQYTTAQDDVAATKDVGKPANQEEANAAPQRPRGGNPTDVG